MIPNILPMRAALPRPDRPPGFDDDVSYPQALVEVFLKEFTGPGDVVLDPFAGFGTTLVVAERMGRRPIGVEILPPLVAWIKRQIGDPSAIVLGDARQLGELDLPVVDFCMTSPPYMNKVDHPQNPLTGYQTMDGDYDRYLVELVEVFDQIKARMSRGGRVVISAANIRTGDTVTTLAWDLAAVASDVLTFEREIVLDWDEPPAWMTNDYCLVFRA